MQLVLFTGRIASRLKGSLRTGAISLVEGILFQVIFTWVVKCNQYVQVLFAHVILQSKYKLIPHLLLERSIHQKIHRRRPLVAWDKTFPEVAREIVVGGLRLGLDNAAD